MPNFTTAQVGMSYPKGRDTITKIFAVARTDNATPKMWLPKDAVVCGIHVYQNVNASTAAATFSVGWSGTANALINGFSMATTAVGLQNTGTATGSSFLTKLTQDQLVTCTYTVGSSTAGGTGYVIIEYFVPGGNEAVDD